MIPFISPYRTRRTSTLFSNVLAGRFQESEKLAFTLQYIIRSNMLLFSYPFVHLIFHLFQNRNSSSVIFDGLGVVTGHDWRIFLVKFLELYNESMIAIIILLNGTSQVNIGMFRLSCQSCASVLTSSVASTIVPNMRLKSRARRTLRQL